MTGNFFVCLSGGIPACAMAVSLNVLSVLTLVLILIHTIRKVIIERNLWLKGQIVVLLLAALQFTLLSLKYAFFVSPIFTLVAVGLKYAQLTLLCYFFVDQALSFLLPEKSRRHVFLVPILFALLFLQSCILLVTIAVSGVDQINCVHVGWVMLSASGFVMSLIFVVAGAFITRRLRSTTMMSASIWRAYNKSLWIVIIVFLLSCAIGVVYDVSLLVLRLFSPQVANRTCEGTFIEGDGVTPYINAVITVCQRVLNLFIPVYAVILGFEIQLRRTSRRSKRHFVTLARQYNETSALVDSDSQSDREQNEPPPQNV